MKRKLFTLAVLAFGFNTFLANAQTIPNADFESWTAGLPDGWSTLFPTGAVSQSTDKQNGSSAVKLAIDPMFGISILATNNSNMLASHAVSNYLNGYIKASLSANDTFLFEAYYTRNSDGMSLGGFDVTSLSRATWTPFHVTITKPAGYIPDSFAIAFMLNPDAASTSSYVMIDNLSFSNTPIGTELGSQMAVGVNNIIKQNINSSLYPNPTSGNAEINFKLTTTSNVTIKFMI